MSILPGQPYLYRGSPSLRILNAEIMADRAAHQPVARPGRAEPPCGTWARYRRHVKAHQPIDEACRLAALEMSRAMKARAAMGGRATQARLREARRTTAPTTPLVPTEPLVISRRKR